MHCPKCAANGFACAECLMRDELAAARDAPMFAATDTVPLVAVPLDASEWSFPAWDSAVAAGPLNLAPDARATLRLTPDMPMEPCAIAFYAVDGNLSQVLLTRLIVGVRDVLKGAVPAGRYAVRLPPCTPGLPLRIDVHHAHPEGAWVRGLYACAFGKLLPEPLTFCWCGGDGCTKCR